MAQHVYVVYESASGWVAAQIYPSTPMAGRDATIGGVSHICFTKKEVEQTVGSGVRVHFMKWRPKSGVCKIVGCTWVTDDTCQGCWDDSDRNDNPNSIS